MKAYAQSLVSCLRNNDRAIFPKKNPAYVQVLKSGNKVFFTWGTTFLNEVVSRQTINAACAKVEAQAQIMTLTTQSWKKLCNFG
jgi:hypothetical protein